MQNNDQTIDNQADIVDGELQTASISNLNPDDNQMNSEFTQNGLSEVVVVDATAAIVLANHEVSDQQEEGNQNEENLEPVMLVPVNGNVDEPPPRTTQSFPAASKKRNRSKPTKSETRAKTAQPSEPRTSTNQKKKRGRNAKANV